MVESNAPDGLVGWPPEVGVVHCVSRGDGSRQPAAFYHSGTSVAKPLLVALHTWSFDFGQEMSIPYARWCIDHDWVLVAPSFRGPDNRPEATGSELAVQDMLDAVAFARAHADVDDRRIYLVGVSGGGHMTLLMAGRAPGLWAAAAAWVPISDLAAWQDECRAAGRPYADDLVRSCGGAPGDSPAVDAQYRARSPLTYLNPAITLPPIGLRLDINAGITDGHTGSVPISHTLRAFNAVAAVGDRINEDDICHFVQRATVPPALQRIWDDPLYGDKRVLFRRTSGNARVTIFDGGHEIIYRAALTWLASQQLQETR